MITVLPYFSAKSKNKEVIVCVARAADQTPLRDEKRFARVNRVGFLVNSR